VILCESSEIETTILADLRGRFMALRRLEHGKLAFWRGESWRYFCVVGGALVRVR
jgi:hypothetical protein